MGVLQPAEAAITRLSLVTPDGPLADVLEELSNHLIAIRKHTKYGQLLEEAKRETQKIFPVIRDREQQLQAMAVDKATLEEQLKQAQADQIRLADVNREIAASVESWRQKAIKTRDTAKSSITKSRKRLVEAEKREKLLQNELEMLKKKRAITVRTRKRQESSKRGLPGAFSPEHVSDDSEEDHDMLFDESGSAREVEGVLAPIPSPIQPIPIASTSSAHLHIHHNAASTTPRSPYHRMFPWQETPQQWQPRFRDSPPPPPQPVHQPTPPQPRRRTFWSYIGL
ncbi:hypothetical protein DL93DRAFT_1780826 [Clavulina sp. PMI_390]|nr:hypothetical protein DL93DRAFT_1780826 [Clavulina sp. PMI_390]